MAGRIRCWVKEKEGRVSDEKREGTIGTAWNARKTEEEGVVYVLFVLPAKTLMGNGLGWKGKTLCLFEVCKNNGMKFPKR